MANADDSAAASVGHCVGANSCKGQSACKSASNSCKGQNSCKGKGFTATSKDDCAKAGGKFEAAKYSHRSSMLPAFHGRLAFFAASAMPGDAHGGSPPWMQ